MEMIIKMIGKHKKSDTNPFEYRYNVYIQCYKENLFDRENKLILFLFRV